jgi:hypothetical protein
MPITISMDMHHAGESRMLAGEPFRNIFTSVG